jgi:hypothetical protein
MARRTDHYALIDSTGRIEFQAEADRPAVAGYRFSVAARISVSRRSATTAAARTS